MSHDILRKLAMQVRNWGRWGPDDEIGTLNFITPDAIAAACRLVTAGKVFALGIPLQREGPQSGTAPPTAATPSSWWRRPCPSPAASARRSTPKPSSDGATG